MTKEKMKHIEGYRRGIAIAKEMLARGLIDGKDYSKVDTMLTKKHGLSLGSIYREIAG